MPMLIAEKYMTTATARFVEEKKKRAAMAPTWKSPIAMEVIQLMRPCWYSRPMRRSCLTFCLTSATAGRGADFPALDWADLISSGVITEGLICLFGVLWTADNH